MGDKSHMIVAAHQPHFLPWLGYLDRMVRADLFVIVDHVQFEKQNYQNRTRIRMGRDVQWLTVPLLQRSRSETIVEKRIDHRGTSVWCERLAGTLQHAYGKAPFFRLYGPEIAKILCGGHDTLVGLNLALLDFCRDALGITTPMVRSSELAIEGQKSEMVLGLCRAVGATTYLAGSGASRRYLDVGEFDRNGISIQWQDFRHPTYPQANVTGEFVPNLAVPDLLYNCGPESGRILRGAAESAAAAPAPALAETA